MNAEHSAGAIDVLRPCSRHSVHAEECASAVNMHEQADKEVLTVCPEVSQSRGRCMFHVGCLLKAWRQVCAKGAG